MSSKKSRVHIIACGVLATDLQRVAAAVDAELTTDYLPGGLHARPNELRVRLQEAIDQASAHEQLDRIVIGYGLCGRGTVGIHARAVPLVIPKVQDCIALFLGSDAAYRREFARYPGTYYFSAGWVTEKVQPKSQEGSGEPRRREDLIRDRAYLVEKYGEEHAEAILEFLNSWQRNYQRAAFIDTGAPGREKFARHAKVMAEELGWLYEQLPGSTALLETALAAEQSGGEVLVVPPYYVTTYDAVSGGLKAVPAWRDGAARPEPSAPAAPAPEHAPRRIRLGLGIDAGGTYTDAVVYDFQSDAVLAKAKAPTTRWDFTVGIRQALEQIEGIEPDAIGLVAVSTTLATNAIVEGQGQKVGLLLMPPYGLFDEADIPHRPVAVIRGRLEIDGTEQEPVDPEEVRRVARSMVEQGVGAFAVSGFAGTVNPEHELAVQALLREATGRSVTCGHQLSEMLNFRTRATTAVLNARIIPRLERFLAEAERALRERGIAAPMMVAKGDGSLMNAATARARPVETIMSGPAASVAGARYLTGREAALVVDIGGTTTDTAALADGAVRVNASGSRVGGYATHVRALDLRTIGLGGDSRIVFADRELSLGPLRVAPVAWLAATAEGTGRALDFLERHLDAFTGDSRGADFLVPTAHTERFDLTETEARALAVLRERPHSLAELAQRLGRGHWTLMTLDRLEEHHLVQRCGLTPTDLLHATGQFVRWEMPTARRLCAWFAALMGLEIDAFIDVVTERFTRRLAVELLKKQFDMLVNPDLMDDCAACQAMLDNMLSGGNEAFRVHIQLNYPIIGVGAPVHHFLPAAARRLKAEVIIPHDADVANAIGAVTSNVLVSHTAAIRPTEQGTFMVDGLPGSETFSDIEAAHRYAVEQLTERVLAEARAAGTTESAVQIQSADRVAEATDGTEMFIEREVRARVSGRPDAALAGA